MGLRTSKIRGFSMVEALLAASIFSLFIVAFSGSLLYGEESSALSGSRVRAALLAQEGIEAVRNMRDANFGALVSGTYGLATSSAKWIFSGAQDVSGIYTRQVSIGATGISSTIKAATSTISWSQNQQRTGSITLNGYLSAWRGCRGGMLVYGDGGTTADTIRYKILDPSTCTWGATSTAADIDTGSTNKALRHVQVYASATRNEKIMLSKHFNGTTQFMYGQVYNGTTGTWGNVQLFASGATTSFQDVHNIAGTYLANGDFMAVYSNFTATPGAYIWNGSTWSVGATPRSLGTNQVPVDVIIKARPGTNEVMAAFLTQRKYTFSQYYSGTNWTSSPLTQHSNNAPFNDRRLVDFDWSPNDPLRGEIVYNSAGNQTASRRMNAKIWTANGSGGGSWSAARTAGSAPDTIDTVAVVGRPGVNEFEDCASDISYNIVCYRTTFTTGAPSWVGPTTILSASTDTGLQRSFHIGFEQYSGDAAIIVYSDRTTVPKLQKYLPTTWDGSATSLSTMAGALKSVRIVPQPNTDEMMILTGDSSLHMYTTIWDGNNNAVYTTPAAYAFTAHGINGPTTVDYWYDFEWDKF